MLGRAEWHDMTVFARVTTAEGNTAVRRHAAALKSPSLIIMCMLVNVSLIDCGSTIADAAS